MDKKLELEIKKVDKNIVDIRELTCPSGTYICISICGIVILNDIIKDLEKLLNYELSSIIKCTHKNSNFELQFKCNKGWGF